MTKRGNGSISSGPKKKNCEKLSPARIAEHRAMAIQGAWDRNGVSKRTANRVLGNMSRSGFQARRIFSKPPKT